MKLKIGRYYSQWGLGISYQHFNNIFKSICIDLIFFYVELIIQDYPKDWFPDGRI